MNVVAVSASGNEGRIKLLAEVSFLPGDLLAEEEVEEITCVGKTVHFRHYVGVVAIVLLDGADNEILFTEGAYGKRF